jgi:hypothetical protein
MLPIGGGYPQHYPLTELLTAWNADVITLPRSHGAFQSLRIFDASQPAEMAEAGLYRRAEVPFVLRNIGAMAATVERWASDELLTETMGATTQYMADTNDNNHFMYYHKGAARNNPDYKPPTGEALVTFPQWLERAYNVTAAWRAEEERFLPPGWAAEPEVQRLAAPSSGVNAPENNGDVQARRENGGAALRAAPPPGSSGGGGGGRGGPLQLMAATHPERELRTMWYLRASTNPRDRNEMTWIHECVASLPPPADARVRALVTPSPARPPPIPAPSRAALSRSLTPRLVPASSSSTQRASAASTAASACRASSPRAILTAAATSS